MSSFSRFQKCALTGIGALSGLGGLAFIYNIFSSPGSNQAQSNQKPLQESPFIHKSWTTNFTPSVNWDTNWDKRDPKSLVKPRKPRSPEDENEYNKKIEAKKSKAFRHLILIRHGQYNLEGNTDAERVLTKLGRKQAECTGKRLAELGLPYSLIVKSTMSRAQETASIIEEFLPKVETKNDSILVEGFPIPPEPPVGHWRPESSDGPRIEAAFRKYFHRADEKQKEDSYTVIVCHANVIRYFACRALQFPPEAWLRISLHHASITWLAIHPSGRVHLRCLGDAGHMPPEYLTTS
ncbi:serine/threonine-protein phosphatase PGAM5, mitochondrial-like isoform X2 [Belonocnema kinseyi]|uniref:serine/threonine-protein phosphatase PGAM5, mitochondrial-like isoform X2 n=1 Tax=Belonocnema kinseyi TaxID=2817044 RepID=UPI00143D5C0A|nr:serine/threonine-protein phosphatase PGAM5, mitochondrial-like isoform X2 [Belonocnema kinseyi]